MSWSSKNMQPDTSIVPGAVNLTKGSPKIDLTKAQVYTIIARWGLRDYDLYFVVEYFDGHTEVVSCFGTAHDPRTFFTQTRDGAVVHVSGDQATSNRGGIETPQEIAKIRLNPKIRSIVPVVYSAQNSGVGSFRKYGVSTYVLPGDFDDVPTTPVDGAIVVTASHASWNPFVYSFVPCVIDNSDPSNPQLDATQQQYSRMSSERRPTVRNGVVIMDAGEENANKARPGC